ncbi:MAG: fumarylacetoacetate hydrolase family protein, partial [Sulfurimonadaceae bacterium]
FDKSAVLSDFVVLDAPLETLRMTLHINEELIQFANYDLMIYKPEMMLEEIKSFMHLEDDDVIMSGTPKGVATFNQGDRFVGRVYSNDKLLVEKEWVVQ